MLHTVSSFGLHLLQKIVELWDNRYMKKKTEKQMRKWNRRVVFLTVVSILIFLYTIHIALFYLKPEVAFRGIHPNTGGSQYYQQLSNWDLDGYSYEDLDLDGKRDVALPSGCIVLSSRDESTIPESQQCRFPEYQQFITQSISLSRTIGEKYLSRQDTVLTYEDEPFHSYLVRQDDNSLWNLVMFDHGKLMKYEITQEGRLERVGVGTSEWVNFLLYLLSYLVWLSIALAYSVPQKLLGGYAIYVVPIAIGWLVILSAYFLIRVYLRNGKSAK